MKRTRLPLFIFIDAFGWDVLKAHDFFLADRVRDRRPLRTILGYSSACDPSIISGLLPCEHGLWSSFYYSPATSPFRCLRPLAILPEALFSRAWVRHYLSAAVKRWYGFTGYFQLYAVPFRHLPLFDYSEKKRIWEPHGLPRGQTIFDLLSTQEARYFVHQSGAGDERNLARLTAQAGAGELDFAYISLGRLDALMHAVGTRSAKVTELVRWYDTRLRELLAAAETAYAEVPWYVFTDHGMHNISATHNLPADVERLGLTFGRDYVAFYDSTMARFWFLTPAARERITAGLAGHPQGRWLADEELRRWGVYFPDHQYGEAIFLMRSGVQMLPSFMGSRFTAGIHGFHPDDPDSTAAISSNQPLPATGLASIHDIFSLMLAETGLTDPRPAFRAGLHPAGSGL